MRSVPVKAAILGSMLLWLGAGPGVRPAVAMTPLEKALLEIGSHARQEVQGNSKAASVAPTSPEAAGSTAVASALTDAGTTLPALADPFALNASADDERIVLSWANTGNAWSEFAGYTVTRRDPDGDAALLTPTLLQRTTYTDVSATAKTQYTYDVRALDGTGTTLTASRPVRAELAPRQPPAPPSDFDVASEEEQVRVKWKPPVRYQKPVAGYLVSRAPTGDGPWTVLNSRLITRDTYWDRTGSYQQDYFYRVAAVDTRGLTGEATAALPGRALTRNRDGLVLMSTAYPRQPQDPPSLTADLQFTYYIGTLYGETDPRISKQALYLDPISLWLLSADAKVSVLTERSAPLGLAAGAKGVVQLFAGQQSAASGQLTISAKSDLNLLWSGYVTASRSFGTWGVHGGYAYGPLGDFMYYLSKYLEPESTRNLVYAGVDFPLARRMNVALEVLYPLSAELESRQHPVLVNAHVDRLLNFDISYLHWDQGWAFLGYFNLRFTLFSLPLVAAPSGETVR